MCGGPAWKREIVPDHKFDFVDVREFSDNGFVMRLKYLWLYMLVLKSFLVYISDIFSAITMLTTSSWHQQVFNNCPNINGCFAIPFKVGQWLFVGCIIFAFLLLAYESRKSKKIIASRDISYAFTNVMANYYYSLSTISFIAACVAIEFLCLMLIGSYDHFCLFEHISNSTKLSDDFAFFVFFVFKSWKRLLLADAPRQIINALTLWAIYVSKRVSSPGPWWDVRRYFAGSDLSAQALMVTTSLTVVVFAGSLLILIVAAICYIPLLCYIRGNLKEYCCHKVDKRIDTLIKRKQKQRLADAAKLARKEALGDYAHLKGKNGEIMPQPTLPNVSVDDDFDDGSSYTRAPPSIDTSYYYADNKADYPPMPAYNQPYSTHQEPGAYAYFNPSQVTLGQDDPYPQQQIYENDADSTMYLPATSERYGQPMHNFAATGVNSNASNYVADPHDVYQGRARAAETARRSPPVSTSRPASVGLAYDDAPEYMSPVSNYGHHPDYSQSSRHHPGPSDEGVGRGGRPYASAI